MGERSRRAMWNKEQSVHKMMKSKKKAVQTQSKIQNTILGLACFHFLN